MDEVHGEQDARRHKGNKKRGAPNIYQAKAAFSLFRDLVEKKRFELSTPTLRT